VKFFSSHDPSIHLSITPSIHVWHHIEKKTLAEINKLPPLRMCRYLGKACPAPGGGTPKILISILATNPTYILTKKLNTWIPNCIPFKNII